MSWLTRIINVFRRERIATELEEEIAAHREEALEHGRTMGSSLHSREHSRDIKLLPWLDSLVSDLVFGFRHLRKHHTASAAAILSLALAIGAVTSAFRLVDAVLLRKLPVAGPDRLYVLATTFIDRDGRPDYRDDFDYPTFRRHVKTLSGLADVMLLSGANRQDAMIGASTEIEKLSREYVSGNAFAVLGLRPTLGRLLTPADDTTPGGHPVAVISYDYWQRRFARDTNVIGKRFRLGATLYEIVGVGPEAFTGTETGVITDAFIPAVMNVQALNADGWSWFRTWVRPKAGVSAEQVRQPLDGQLANELRDRARHLDSDAPKQAKDRVLKQSIILLPGGSGATGLKKDYFRPLVILSILVAFVLLIACANVGNLLAAQAASRARELALRVSIGAGQWRLIQLVLVECALLAGLATALGALFSLWSAPFVVAMLAPPEQPVRLVLNADWRLFAFAALLALTVTLLFGITPALRASRIKPLADLKGGADGRPHRGVMNALVAAQVAFCLLVLFVAGLFVSTFQRLSTRPLGFSPTGLLIVGAGAPGKPQPPETWRQLLDHLRQLPGVQSAAYAGWAPLSGNNWTGTIRVPGRAAEPLSPYFLDISPGYFETMRIGWIDGRDFRPGDGQPNLTGDNRVTAGVGIVNEAFARTYFDGRNPIGKVVGVRVGRDLTAPMEIVGYVRDSCYSDVREIIRPTVYLASGNRTQATIVVRAGGDARTLTSILRREIPRARSDFRVRNIEPQSALVGKQMLRERLLATLSFFFAAIALALAAIGLYGVLNYGIICQRREIGIRIALGARSVHVVRRMTASVFAVVLCGAAIGIAGGIACGRFVETLLYEVKPGDSGMIAAPVLVLLAAALLAAVPPAIRATRIDPAQTLRE